MNTAQVQTVIERPWLRLEEAAKYVNLSYEQARKLQARGLFPGIKQGKGRNSSVLCHVWALDAWRLLEEKTPLTVEAIKTRLKFQIYGGKAK